MIIYKTTNLLNEKIYIGQDSNNDPKYLGSGIHFSGISQVLRGKRKKAGKFNWKYK